MKRILSLLLVVCLLLPAALAEAVQYPLLVKISNANPSYRMVAHIDDLEGYLPLEGITPNATGSEPEYYFVPEEAESPVRFVYYTTGYGNSRSLAETAVESYATFYEEFAAGEITKVTLADKECLTFSYTCSYAGEDGVTPIYEQSALCYIPVEEGSFIACILSLAFESAEGYWEADALNALLEQNIAAVKLTA